MLTLWLAREAGQSHLPSHGYIIRCSVMKGCLVFLGTGLWWCEEDSHVTVVPTYPGRQVSTTDQGPGLERGAHRGHQAADNDLCPKTGLLDDGRGHTPETQEICSRNQITGCSGRWPAGWQLLTDGFSVDHH